MGEIGKINTFDLKENLLLGQPMEQMQEQFFIEMKIFYYHVCGLITLK